MAARIVTTISRADKIKIAVLVLLVAAVPAYVVLPMVRDQLEAFFSIRRAQVFGVVLLAILLEAFPFVLLGSIVSGAIEVLVSPEGLMRLVPRRPAARLALAPLLGLVFPVCECGVVPVVRRLIRKGLPADMAIVYLLAGPIINPIVIASTVLAFSRMRPVWVMPAARVGVGVLVAVAAGAVLVRLDRGRPVLGAAAPAPPARDLRGGVLGAIVHHAAHDFLLLGGFLLLGSIIAAAAQAFVPRTILVSVGRTPFVSSAGMMALAFVLNLCSEADAFVAASFVQFSFASKLAFLVLGPMLDVKLVAMYLGAFPRRLLVVVLAVAPAMVLVLSELVGLAHDGLVTGAGP
jgi:hypothetical protein